MQRASIGYRQRSLPELLIQSRARSAVATELHNTIVGRLERPHQIRKLSTVFDSVIPSPPSSSLTPFLTLALRATIRRMTNYKIDVVSDTVCPWCYVGKNRLNQAIQAHKQTNPDDTFTMTWYPFYLNPDAPRSIDKQEYYERKFGAQRTQVMQGHLARLGKQVGIDFAFDGKTGNTRDSHRLIQLAKTKGEGMQTKVVEQLFNAYFEANEDITSQEVLIARGVKAGLDEREVRGWMENGKGGPEVDKEVLQAQRKFITGVPNFTVNGKYEVQGAEEPAAFLQVFGEVKDTVESVSGGKIGGDNVC